MIYLDNCSTTRMREEVLAVMVESLGEDFANPSSLHSEAFKVEKKIGGARKLIADYLGVREREIFFTSGGTESNNLALNSSIDKMKNRGDHIITSSIEHPSVLNVFKHYEELGYRVSYLGVNSQGQVDLEELEELLDDGTILVSIMQVNNEIGTIQDLARISSLIKANNRETIFHVDGVQAFGKLDFQLRAMGVDIYSFCSHKIHGPKGIGGLYIREDLALRPSLFGGNQERGFRSGTENVPAILAFAQAVELMDKNHSREFAHIRDLNAYLRERLGEIDDVKINSPRDLASPYIINLSILDTRGEVLLHFLEGDGIFISTSSACSSNNTEKSHVLKGIGLDNREIEGSLRICFSYDISREDIDIFVDRLKLYVEEVRDIMR